MMRPWAKASPKRTVTVFVAFAGGVNRKLPYATRPKSTSTTPGATVEMFPGFSATSCAGAEQAAVAATSDNASHAPGREGEIFVFI